MMKKKVTVFAPATVANLGCGFDAMGLAIDWPGDIVTLIGNDEKKIRVVKITGDDKKLSSDATKNTASVAVKTVLDALELDHGVDVILEKKLPIGSGLGSSAASSVAGAFAINEMLGRPFTRHELIPFAMEGEYVASGARHADNAAPSMLGGIVLIRSYDPFEVVELPVPSKLKVIVVHPDVELLTKDSRAVLPEKFYLKAGVAQWANTASLVSGLYTNDYPLIGRSITDHIAEPYRARLIPHFTEVQSAAMKAGALACTISGSGPSVFALTDNVKDAARISAAMKKEFNKVNIKCSAYVSGVNKKGVRVIKK